MPDHDAIIIGGGHNALVCAGYLARAGLDVLVLERRDFVGGATATEELFPGFHVSSCSYICHLLQAKVIDDLEMRKHGFEVLPLDPEPFQPYPDGRRLARWHSPERTQAELASFSLRDAAALPQWNAFWRRAAGIVYPWFLRRPPSLGELKDSVAGTDDAAFLQRLLTVSMGDLVREFFEDEAVRGSFLQVQDVGDPEAAGGAFCYTHIRCDAFSRPEDIGIVRGGMGMIANSLADSAREHGVHIRTGSIVERITIDAEGARGVVLDDGTEISSKLVVSGADPKRTLLGLVGPDHLPADWVTPVREMKTRTAYLKFHAALDRLPDFSRYFPDGYDPRYIASMKLCPSMEYYSKAWHDAAAGRPATEPVMEVQIPSVIDDSLTQPGQHVMSVWGLYAPVQPRDSNWDQIREAVGEALIDVLCQYAPELRDCLIDWSLFTPADLEKRVWLTDGNIRHLDSVPEQFLDLRPMKGWAGYGTPIAGLFLCGAGTHPGGEVTGACGHNAAHTILETL
ncbi:MAG: NAD(P)/FAD-dependent oxidoreductase [Planctomycetota bacterium]|nr:NAD(P)/FAD-dependent oxidoreductase [Planctomycetota bacterium]